MTPGTSAIGVIVCLGIAATILSGFLAYRIARRKPPGGVTDETEPKKEKDGVMTQKSENGATPKDFPAPWHAKVSTEALPPSQPTGDKSAPKPKSRPAPVVMMVSGSTERPAVKRVAGEPEGMTK